MDFDVRVENSRTIVSLSGRLDAVTAPVCEQKFRDLIAGDNLSLVVDFEALEYISSMGLRTLLVLAKLVKENNGRVCLANVNHHVRSVFEISHFTSIFEIKDSVAEALAAIS
jgi:stage II sporulation protein AA (anti-sigma F factor antagonist)